ncbi:glycosyl hydrolase family 65 protein [Lacticaseibacillus manihotivorans]
MAFRGLMLAVALTSENLTVSLRSGDPLVVTVDGVTQSL